MVYLNSDNTPMKVKDIKAILELMDDDTDAMINATQVKSDINISLKELVPIFKSYSVGAQAIGFIEGILFVGLIVTLVELLS